VPGTGTGKPAELSRTVHGHRDREDLHGVSDHVAPVEVRKKRILYLVDRNVLADQTMVNGRSLLDAVLADALAPAATEAA